MSSCAYQGPTCSSMFLQFSSLHLVFISRPRLIQTRVQPITRCHSARLVWLLPVIVLTVLLLPVLRTGPPPVPSQSAAPTASIRSLKRRWVIIMVTMVMEVVVMMMARVTHKLSPSNLDQVLKHNECSTYPFAYSSLAPERSRPLQRVACLGLLHLPSFSKPEAKGSRVRRIC